MAREVKSHVILDKKKEKWKQFKFKGKSGADFSLLNIGADKNKYNYLVRNETGSFPWKSDIEVAVKSDNEMEESVEFFNKLWYLDIDSLYRLHILDIICNILVPTATLFVFNFNIFIFGLSFIVYDLFIVGLMSILGAINKQSFHTDNMNVMLYQIRKSLNKCTKYCEENKDVWNKNLGMFPEIKVFRKSDLDDEIKRFDYDSFNVERYYRRVLNYYINYLARYLNDNPNIAKGLSYNTEEQKVIESTNEYVMNKVKSKIDLLEGILSELSSCGERVSSLCEDNERYTKFIKSLEKLVNLLKETPALSSFIEDSLLIHLNETKSVICKFESLSNENKSYYEDKINGLFVTLKNQLDNLYDKILKTNAEELDVSLTVLLADLMKLEKLKENSNESQN